RCCPCAQDRRERQKLRRAAPLVQRDGNAVSRSVLASSGRAQCQSGRKTPSVYELSRSDAEGAQVKLCDPTIEAAMSKSTSVVMIDLFSFVPYYTGHLCACLQKVNGLQVTLASVTYQHDLEYFQRQAVSNDPGLLDVTYRMRWIPAGARRLLKAGEYLIN